MRSEKGKEGRLVTVDGETRLELETLLRASAYVVGTKGGSIVYRAVVEDGRAFAVRRIGVGECGVERMKDFESQVKAIAKIRHPNLVRVRGFCWGELEKLVICDYVPNGSLATISHSKSSLFTLSFFLSFPSILACTAQLREDFYNVIFLEFEFLKIMKQRLHHRAPHLNTS